MNILMPYTRAGIFRSAPGGGPPTFPTAGARMLYAPDYNPSILTAASLPATYMQEVSTIQDLSGNNRHATWISGNKPLYLTGEAQPYLWCNGVPTAPNAGGGGSSVAYAPIMDMDEFTFEMEVAMDDWTPAAYGIIACRWENAAGGPWIFYHDITGTMTLQWFSPGSTVVTSSASMTFANNTKAWVRFHYTRNTGSGQYAVIFATSLDGTTWTQLGSTLTGASTGGMNNSSKTLRIAGGNPGPAYGIQGRVYSFALRSGGGTGTKVVNWNGSMANHFSATSTEAANGLLFSHRLSPTDSSGVRALIGRGALWVDGGIFAIASPMATDSGDYITGLISCARNVAGTAISFSSNAPVNSHPYGIYHAAGAIYSAHASASIQQTIETNGVKVRAIARQIGSVGYFNTNGTIVEPTPAISVGTAIIDRLFSRSTTSSRSVYGRLGHWTGASLPTPLEVENFLEATL